MPSHPDLRDELLRLERLDQTTRDRLAASGELFGGYAPEMEAVHLSNARQLEAMIETVGWPGRRVVGEDGAEAAWRIAQHAISWPDFQRRCLGLLTEAEARGDVPPRHAAQLTDRIRFNERKPQVYATILDWDEDGELGPGPIEEPESLDRRRRGAGLPPLAEVLEQCRSEAVAEGHAPPDQWRERQRTIELWARRVGWLSREK